MEQLLAGFKHFRESHWAENRLIFQELATHGQAPRALVIACSDSRVDPQMIFQTMPGQIFSVRNVANLVPPYSPDAEYHGTSAALEFAVRSLKVEHIVVLGHSHCGGVNALLNGSADGADFVLPWMRIATEARRKALAAPHDPAISTQRRCEYEGIKVSLANLMTFPWISDPVKDGKMTLHGWYFDIELGELHRLDPQGSFTIL